MNRKRLGQFATVITSASLLLMLVGLGTASAATPGWTRSNAVNIMNTVGPGKDAGYTVTLYNDGPGNISTLYLKSSSTASYSSNSACNTTGSLNCALGALNVGQSIQLIVAIQVPNTAGTFSPTFLISTNGAPTTDRGNTSRGDSFTFGETTTVSTGGGNFDGGFVVGPDVYTTNQSVGRNNIQATTLESAPSYKTVTINDGDTIYYPCTASVTQCSRLIGEWSELHVGDGTDGPMKVTLKIFGNAVTGNPDPSSLFLVHTSEGGATSVIERACAYTGDVDCLVSASKIGKNYEIVAWLATNGGLRGGY